MWHQVNSFWSCNSKAPCFAGEIYRSCFEQQMFLVAQNGYAISIDCKDAWYFFVGSNLNALKQHCLTSKDLIV